MAKTHIEVKKNSNENNASLLRRFSRKVMDSGIIQKVKSKRYSERPTSKLSLKEMKLRRITHRVNLEHLRKLGKAPEARVRR